MLEGKELHDGKFLKILWDDLSETESAVKCTSRL